MSVRGGGVRGALGRLYDLLPGKRIVLDPLRRMVRLPEPVFRHLHFRGIFTVRAGPGSFRLRHHGTQIENEIFWMGLEGGWEPATLRLWLRLAATAATVVDVGANTGVFALAARAVNRTARVVAIEPVEEVWRRLDDNCRLNGGTVETVRAAATDRDGTAELLVPEGENPLSASLEPGGYAGDLPLRLVQVTAVRLDSLLGATSAPPVLIKVDVEGHEAAVLRGLGGRMGALRPVLFVEVRTEAAAVALSGLLEPQGYRYFHIHERAWPTPAKVIRPLPGGLNYLCCGEGVARDLGLAGSTPATPRGAAPTRSSTSA